MPGRGYDLLGLYDLIYDSRAMPCTMHSCETLGSGCQSLAIEFLIDPCSPAPVPGAKGIVSIILGIDCFSALVEFHVCWTLSCLRITDLECSHRTWQWLMITSLGSVYHTEQSIVSTLRLSHS